MKIQKSTLFLPLVKRVGQNSVQGTVHKSIPQTRQADSPLLRDVCVVISEVPTPLTICKAAIYPVPSQFH